MRSRRSKAADTKSLILRCETLIRIDKDRRQPEKPRRRKTGAGAQVCVPTAEAWRCLQCEYMPVSLIDSLVWVYQFFMCP